MWTRGIGAAVHRRRRWHGAWVAIFLIGLGFLLGYGAGWTVA